MTETFGSGEYTYRAVEGWAKWPEDWQSARRRGGRRRQQGPGLRVPPRRPSDRRLRQERQRAAHVGRGHLQARARHSHGAGRHDLPDRRRRSHGAQVHARRQGAADHRRSRQARAVHERRAVPPLHAHRAVAQQARSTCRTATATRRSTSTRRTASACCRGASPAPVRASSTCRTTSRATPTAGCTSPIGRITGSRSSTATARFETQWHNLHRPSGMYMPPGKCPVCYVGEIGPYYEFNRGAPNLGPRVTILSNEGKVLSRVTREPSGDWARASSSRRMDSPSIRAATCTWAKSAIRRGRRSSPIRQQPKRIRSLQKYEKVRRLT